MSVIEIYDPAMCCSTGVCGTDLDPALARVASMEKWLRNNGHEVKRYNLSQDPFSFAMNPKVKAVMEQARDQDSGLPVVLVDGEIVRQGGYPDRAELAEIQGLSLEEAS